MASIEDASTTEPMARPPVDVDLVPNTEVRAENLGASRPTDSPAPAGAAGVVTGGGIDLAELGQAENFRTAMLAYSRSLDKPAQWNPWQRVAFRVALSFPEEFAHLSAKEKQAQVSTFYAETMREIHGDRWRIKRAPIEASAAFSASPPGLVASGPRNPQPRMVV